MNILISITSFILGFLLARYLIHRLVEKEYERATKITCKDFPNGSVHVYSGDSTFCECGMRVREPNGK